MKTKKIIPKLLMIVFVIALSFIACNKKKIPTSNAETKESTQNLGALNRSGGTINVISGMLSFSTFSDYEEIVNDVDSTKEADWYSESESINFNSLLEKKTIKVDLYNKINSDYFASIINEDGFVKISNFVFKINPFDSTGYVLYLPTNTLTASDLTNLSNQDLSVDNVIGIGLQNDMISILKEFISDVSSNNYTGTFKAWWTNYKSINTEVLTAYKTTRCRESGCGERWTNIVVAPGPGIFMDVFYNRSGIHFSLRAEIWPVGSTNSAKFEINPLCYKIKCGGNTGPYSGEFNGRWRLSKQLYQSYQGSTPLNGFKFRVRGWSSTGGGVWSSWATISANAPC